ncbi:MAG: tRNA epoxyqueuosine(34) reductase QueG [Brevefilum sp.]
MHRLSTLKQTLRTEAHRLGFTHFGVSPAHPIPHLQTYLAWVGAGRHADMGYLARPDTLAKRADPSLILAGCQRVICMAMPYDPPHAPPGETRPGWGRISAYARTTDYHLTIQDKLYALEAFIHTQGGDHISLKSYVDTGPVLERAYAVQAGLGMFGKNTNLIIPKTGSYLFLAVILTDLELPNDPPFTRDLCRSCQRCIEACPTGCIRADRTLDAGRCISYLTIENKGIIPDPLKRQVGSWLFGCDICQMVCPHNARAASQPGALGQPRLPEFMDVVEIITWGQAEFKAATDSTALSRAKLRGLVRNAAIVLGNQREIQALPAITTRLAQETDPIIQDALKWAIHQIEHNGPTDD